MAESAGTSNPHIGGVIHTYLQYDPVKFPAPTLAQPDVVSGAFEHLLEYGSLRRLTEEELARAVRLTPDQFAGLGPSLDALIRQLKERKEKILRTYESRTVQKKSLRQLTDAARSTRPPAAYAKSFWSIVREEQIYALEQLWYRVEKKNPDFASRLLSLLEVLGEKYQVDQLTAKYEFTGNQGLTVPQAIELLEELTRIDELLRQLEAARENAQLAVIDLDELSEFTDAETIESLARFQEQVQQYLRDVMEHQGLSAENGQIQLSPKAYRLFQGRLLETIFSDLQNSRSGRHSGAAEGDGAAELQRTRPYEFGDSVSQMDIPATLLNAMLRQGGARPIQLKQSDIEIHRTRNNPKCATTVLMDMSGSMRYDGQYVSVKRMALALNGLISREFPGDFLCFADVHSFARIIPVGELLNLMPKIPTITNPVVRLRADMSRPDVSEMHIPPHFTNIQHGLQLARQILSVQDTPNRQVILITDGLPTAHFEAAILYLLYPPDPRTEEATMREGLLCRREGITINIFLLPSWSQTREDVQFAHRLAESTGGRVFFASGRDLDRYVVWDYVQHRRQIIG